MEADERGRKKIREIFIQESIRRANESRIDRKGKKRKIFRKKRKREGIRRLVRGRGREKGDPHPGEYKRSR